MAAQAPRPRGRPTKYDEKKAEQICAALSEGLFMEHAAALVGVDTTTVYRWIARGKNGLEPFASFGEKVRYASAQFALVSQREIVKGGDKERGLRWILERRFPKKYGERVQIHVERHMSEVFDKLEKGLQPDVFAKVLAVLSGEDSPSEAGEDQEGQTLH